MKAETLMILNVTKMESNNLFYIKQKKNGQTVSGTDNLFLTM